jgi:Tfp pilus assembly protein PilV
MYFLNNRTNQYEQRGQSLVEILLAMGIFILAVSAGAFFVLDIYLSVKLGREITTASFLAKEGLEAARSIRNNNWDDLTQGEFGLALVSNNWVLAGTHEDVSGYLSNGTRKVILEDIDADRKKITTIVSWELTENRAEQVSYTTFLTNLAKIPVASEDCNTYCQSIGYGNGVCRANPGKCDSHGESNGPEGDQYCSGGNKEDTCCCLP